MAINININPAFRTLVNNSLKATSSNKQSPRTLLEFIQQKNATTSSSEPYHISLTAESEPFDLAGMDTMTHNSFFDQVTKKINKRVFLLAFCKSQLPNGQIKQSIMAPFVLYEWLTSDRSRDHESIYDPATMQPFSEIDLILLDVDTVKINHRDQLLQPLYTCCFNDGEYNVLYDITNEELRDDEWMLRCLLLEGLLLNKNRDANRQSEKNIMEYILRFSNDRVSLLTHLFNSFDNLDYQESEQLKKLFTQDLTVKSVFQNVIDE